MVMMMPQEVKAISAQYQYINPCPKLYKPHKYITSGLQAILALTYLVKRPRSHLPLPPGPKKYPLIGNLLDLPTTMQWNKYAEWSKQYGSDVIQLEVLGHSIIVLNSLDAANDLLVRRSSIYSSRTTSTMLNELMGWNWALGFMPYGERWRRHRRLFWQEFNENSTKRHQPQELAYSRVLLRRLLDSPERFIHHCGWCLGATIISTSYGLHPKSDDDLYVRYGEEAMATLAEAGIPGSYLVDSLPILKYVPTWFPGAQFQAVASRARFLLHRMIEVPYSDAKKLLVSSHSGHDDQSSFLSRCFEREREIVQDPHKELLIKNVIAAAYSAGSDTTPSALVFFVASMLLFPGVQKKAQAELDNVLGSGRLPNFEDLDTLPYTYALILEVLRWQAIAPIGIPHASTMEDEYKGYRIPANSTVIPNIWAILHDEKNFPEPDKFKPERFLCDGKVKDEFKDPVAIFGFGRRICPGRFMALSSLWISAVSILSVFNISEAIDREGNLLKPDIKCEEAFVRHALFKCSIKPRSADAETLIRESH